MRAMNPTNFVGALERLTRVYEQAKRIALSASGLSSEELSVLSEAGRRPRVPIGQIASVLSMSGSAASRIVKGLLKKGFLSGNGEGVEATARGREATDQVWAAFAQALGGAASIATAMAGLIGSMTSLLDRWVDRTLPAPPKKRHRR